jgi:hypothetical protein
MRQQDQNELNNANTKLITETTQTQNQPNRHNTFINQHKTSTATTAANNGTNNKMEIKLKTELRY